MKLINNKNNYLITFFIFIFIFSFINVNYSVKAEEVEEINLKKAFELAYENNSELKKAERSREKSELNLDLAWRALFPDLKLETSYTRMSEAPKISTPNYTMTYSPEDFYYENKPVRKKDQTDVILAPETIEGPKENYNTSLSFTQPIYMGGQIRLGIEQAKRGLKMAEVQNKKKKSETLHQIINSYYNLLMARERVEIEKQSLLLVKEHKNIAESSYESGAALKTDLLQAEIELSKAKNRLKNSKNKLKLAKKNFKNQLGINKSKKIILQDNSQFIPEVNLEKENLYKTALTEKPEIKILEYNQDLTQTNLKLEEKSNYPKIMLMGNYNWQGSELDFEDGSGNIVLSASMNIFDSGKSNIKEDKIEKDLQKIDPAVTETRFLEEQESG